MVKFISTKSLKGFCALFIYDYFNMTTLISKGNNKFQRIFMWNRTGARKFLIGKGSNMKDIDNSLLNYLIKENLSTQMFKGEFGLEKENLRVDETGRLALTPHPVEFGNKLLNPYITTDFSESQVEMITPVCSSLEDAYYFLENLQDIISLSLNGEYLWPQSNPPVLPEEKDIPLAVYESEGNGEREYREKLAKKYGRKKQLLSGIHYNFSFNEDFIKVIYKEFGNNKSFKDFKDSIYLKITKNFLRYRWLLIYLTGASPVFHRSFEERFTEISEKLDNESYYFENISSLRNSKCGYKNDEDFFVNYDSLDEYISSIKSLIEDGKIESASEFYNPIRIKGSKKKAALDQLKDGGIKYLELRIFDLNPFNKNGISLEDLYFINLFMIYMFLKNDNVFGEKQQKISNKNHDLATVVGSKEGANIYNESGELVSLSEEAINILDDLEEIVKLSNFKADYLTGITKAVRERILDPKKTYAHRIIEQVKDKSYIGFHMEKAKEYLKDSVKNKVNLIGYEDLELSTQLLIKDAVRTGIAFEIVDRGGNFVRFSKDERVEYVKQATKTSRDSYSTVLIMENKVVTKKVLKEHNLIVPDSESFDNIEDAKNSFNKFKDKKIVIKPKSTNFGVGISILKDNFSGEQFDRALEIAFRHDKSILVEEYVSGREFRFLVIGDEVAAVLHRVPANVQGDGNKSILELVNDKNNDPLRGVGHRAPLEKIVLGEIEEMFLESQGKDFNYIPGPGEVVFLRENSNISTGGDSLDYTDSVHKSYKEIAVKSAKAVGAAITGVDMIIEDIGKQLDETNYAIIELNFNPALHMHYYPYKGQNRRVGEKVLNLLFDK